MRGDRWNHPYAQAKIPGKISAQGGTYFGGLIDSYSTPSLHRPTMDTTSAKKKLKISDNVTVKKSKDEKDLESYLFGDMDDQVWDRAGHELSDQGEDEDDQAQSSANEDDNAEEVIVY